MSCCINIDLGRLSNNLLLLKNGAKDKLVCAVVKADAYGHGAKKVSKTIENKVDYFAVANALEGVELRKVGINKPILVLSADDNDSLICVKFDLTIGVGTLLQALKLKNLFIKENKSCPIHIQIDTGMHRLGFSNTCDVKRVIELFDKNIVTGVYSHIYSQKSYSAQIERFKEFEQLVKSYNSHAISHLSSTFYASNSYGDMIRAGLCLYGYPREKFLPVMSFESVVLNVIDLDSFDNCGYEGLFINGKKPQKIAIIQGGYADGISRDRRTRTGVLFKGELLPIIAVCMDSVTVLASNVDISRGDIVKFVGESDSFEYYFDEIARQVGTIEYELMTSIGKRVRRNYIDIKN